MALCCVCCTTVQAGASMLTIYNGEEYELADYMGFFEDPDHHYSIDELVQPENSEKFINLDNKLFTYGLTRANLWFRIKVHYPVGAPNFAVNKRLLFEVAKAMLSEAELYTVRADGTISKLTSDVRTPFSKRPICHAFSVFPVDLALGEKVTLYLKIRNNSSTYVPQKLWSEAGFAKKVTIENFMWGIFYGGLIFICLYNVLLYFSSREIGYFYYVGYLISVILFTGVDNGHGIALFSNDDHVFDKRFFMDFVWIAMLMGCVMINHFLEFKSRHPILHYFMMANIALIIISFFISNRYDPVSTIAFATKYASGMGVIVFIAVGYCAYKGNPNAPYFVFAWLFDITGMFIYSLIVGGVVPAHPLLLAAMPLGLWFEAIILSRALANRIKQSEKAAMDANKRAIDNLARYRSVFNNALEGLYQMSLGGRLLSMNPAFTQMLGLAASERALKNGQAAVSLLYSSPAQQLQRLADDGEMQYEADFINLSGQHVHIVHKARLVRNERGEPLHIEGTLIDIGERKRCETAQRDWLRERREKEVARNVTKAKSDFLKRMSYEIRTPLTAIIGFSEAMRDTPLSAEKKKQAIASITDNSHHLLLLINDILDYSKIEAGKMTTESIPCELMPLINGVVDHFSLAATDKGLTFSTAHVYPLPKHIVSDPTRISQMMFYLCSNAIKFTSSGKVTLQVNWDNMRHQLVIAVADTGDCIHNARVRRIMLSPQQLRGSQIGGDVDLGIVITHQLAQLLGGNLTIDCEKGKGSQFVINLDCQLEENTEWITEVVTGKPPPRPASQEIPLLKGRVLLAEDNPVNQKLIQRVIGKTGAGVVVVGNGQEALETAAVAPFDLILMDINMPVMGGLEATQTLRAKGYSHPIYALTAEHGQQEIDASISAGCDGHLHKPLELVPFYKVLAKCLQTQVQSS